MMGYTCSSGRTRNAYPTNTARKTSSKVRFHVFTKASIGVWNDALRSLVDIDRCYRGTYCFHHRLDNAHRLDNGGSKYLLIVLTMEAVSTSVTSLNFYETTWMNIPADTHLLLKGDCLENRGNWMITLRQILGNKF
jgi:hypothetical protein